MNITKEEELAGGIKNALERGEPLPKIKQSFINAGYKPEEVERAARKILHPELAIPPTPKPIETKKIETQPIPAQQPTIQKLPVQPIQKQKTFSKKLIIILTIVSILILVGAALLGLYWDKLF